MEFIGVLNKRFIYILLFIIFLFLSTRLFKISTIPASVYWDEASIGYNAYSIATDLKDEWGEVLPLHFRAFGEFKLPVYIYSVVPFVKLIGLNELAIRLPAVIYSALTLITIYFLGGKIKNKTVGIFAAFFFSLSQGYFIFSRTGYEATAGLFFFLIAIYLFLKSFENSKYFILATLALIISFYSYNSFRVLSLVAFPVMILVLKYKNRSDWKQSLLPVLVSIGILLISLVPVYRLFKYDYGASRLGAIGINAASKKQLLLSFSHNYLSHFSPKFLITNGDANMRSSLKGFGELSLVEVPLILLGLIYIAKNRRSFMIVPVLLLLIAPIPAAITRESPHALRAILMFPAFSLISAFGINYMLEKYSSHTKQIAFIFVSLFFVFFSIYFLRFSSVYNQQSSGNWQYGYKQIFTSYDDQIKKANNLVVSEEYAQPYIFALFYQKIDPKFFRETAHGNSVDRWGFSTVSDFGKFKFKKVTSEDFAKGNLIFSLPTEKNQDPIPIDEIKFLNGQTAFFVYLP